MALRLRRGTNAERLLVTPLEGELIYTTDTKILYIGDGVTQGGLQVTGAFPESINDLNDVDIASLAPEVGQVLKWNGTEFIPADLIEVGEQANIDIIADDSTILIDSETQNIQGNIFTGDTFVGNLFNGTFVGDGSGLTNLPIATDGSGIVLGSNYRINIAADDSTIIVDSSTSTFTGRFVGDGSNLTNVPSSITSIFDLNDVFSFTPPDPNDVLIFDGFNFTPQKIRRIEGFDSTILLDTETNTFTGNFVGDGSGLTNLPVNEIIDGSTFRINVIGDLQGSIFGDDSTLIVDAINNAIIADSVATPNIQIINDLLTVSATNTSDTNAQTVSISSNENNSIIKLTRTSTNDDSLTDLPYGRIFFERNDINGSSITGVIVGTRDKILIGVDANAAFPENKFITLVENGNFGIRTFNPTEALDVVGNAIISGSLTAGAMLLSGSNIDTSDSSAITVTPAVTFNSDVIVENNLVVTNTLTVDTLEVTNFQTSSSGTLELASDTDILLTAGTRVEITQSPLKMASFTTTERNALTPQNGDVIYNITDSKFQGYAGGTWVDLH